MSFEKTQLTSITPLPCDRWIARSCLQKAIRRGDVAVAVSALANLFLYDPRAIWRHLTIIALEDVGVANIGVLRRLVAAKLELRPHRIAGLLWTTFVTLTELLAASEHCQAVCDLLMRVENDPALFSVRQQLIDDGPSRWASVLYDRSRPIEHRATAALCFGGFLRTGFSADPSAALEICSDCGEGVEIVRLAAATWKLSRNPMALLLPIVWQHSQDWTGAECSNEMTGDVENLSGVPEYALDQFTRVGKSAIRAFLEHDCGLRDILSDAGIDQSSWAHVTGDLVFLIEGGLCVRRWTWSEAEMLRQPARWLPSVSLLGDQLQGATNQVASQRRELRKYRQQLFQRAHGSRA